MINSVGINGLISNLKTDRDGGIQDYDTVSRQKQFGVKKIVKKQPSMCSLIFTFFCRNTRLLLLIFLGILIIGIDLGFPESKLKEYSN